MRPFAVLLVCAFVLTGNATHAAELFVFPAGNDSSGAGTLESPYGTIQHVLDNVAGSGDIITLRNGTYNEEIRIRKPNITIRSKSGEWATISTPPNLDPYEPVITVNFDVESKGSKLQQVEVTGDFTESFSFPSGTGMTLPSIMMRRKIFSSKTA